MHALLIIMLAPLALTLGVVLIGALLDPRIWIMALIIAALLAIGLGLQSAKASVLPDEVFPALPGVGCESCGPRCVGRAASDPFGGVHRIGRQHAGRPAIGGLHER